MAILGAAFPDGCSDRTIRRGRRDELCLIALGLSLSCGPSPQPPQQPVTSATPTPLATVARTTTTTMTTVVPATPSPPTPAPSVDLLEPEMMRMLDQLREGSLAYTPKTEMRQGDTTAVIARISLGQPDLNLGRGLPSPAIQGLKVSRTMVATLTAVEKDAFEIRAVSDEEQIIAPPYAEWKWDVVPLRHGDHGLHLSVRAVVRADGAEKRRDYPSQDVTIHVRVNPGYLVSSFLGSNWQWLLGSPIVLGAGAWLAARLREKKRRQAGF